MLSTWPGPAVSHGVQQSDAELAPGRELTRLFYQGEIGARLVELCRESGGHLSRQDLTSYQVIERTPLKARYQGAELLTNPPPSAGGVLIRHTLQALRDGKATPVFRSVGRLVGISLSA